MLNVVILTHMYDVASLERYTVRSGEQYDWLLANCLLSTFRSAACFYGIRLGLQKAKMHLLRIFK